MRLTSLLLASALAVGGAAVPLVGCTGEGTLVVEDAPPAPREEVVVTRPGFVFVHGHWNREGGRWVWVGGRYERERVGKTFIQGHWERRGHQHVWIEGGWRG